MGEEPMTKRVEIFCCYARDDQPLLHELLAHLMPLQRQGLITIWSDRDINAGSEWEQAIAEHLTTAQIILLLVSPSFMASEYCYGKEMAQALARHERGEARVIPVILRPVYWQNAPFGKLQVLPTDGHPVTGRHWHTQDEAFFTITQGAYEAVGQLITELRAPSQLSHQTEEKMFSPLQPGMDSSLDREAQVPAALQPTQLATLGGKTKEQWLAEGDQRRKRRRYEDALKAYNYAIKLDPNYADAYAFRGTIYGYLKRDQMALNDFDRAMKLAPRSAKAYSSRGEFYCDRQEHGKALVDLKHAMVLDPTYDFSYINRSYVYLDRQEYSKALADCEHAIELNPESGRTYYARGRVYIALEEYHKALADCEYAIELDPDLVSAYYGRALVYLKIGEDSTAIDEFSHTIKLDIEDASAYFNRGLAYSNLQQFERALQDFDRALVLLSNEERNARFGKELGDHLRVSKQLAELQILARDLLKRCEED
jgi:tetratricopeptide (TPR) repeat protein